MAPGQGGPNGYTTKGPLKLAAREPITDMLDVEVEAVQKATDDSNFEYRADADADADAVVHGSFQLRCNNQSRVHPSVSSLCTSDNTEMRRQFWCSFYTSVADDDFIRLTTWSARWSLYAPAFNHFTVKYLYSLHCQSKNKPLDIRT